MSNNSGSGNAASPVITTVSGQDAGAVTEDGTLKATGQLSATEAASSHPDLDWSVVGNGHGSYGSLSIDDNGKWTYTLNNNASTVQALAQGEVVTETFTVQVSDHGKTATEVVTVNITGSDDAPVISAPSSQTNGTVQEDNTLTATGKLTASDVDHNASLTWSVADGAGTYGSLSIDQTGKWTYTLNNAADNVQALAKNQQVTETFTVQVKDQFGAVDTQTITVKVVGSNDAPVIAGTSTGIVQEDATLKTSGQLSATDVDHGSQLNWSVADRNGDYGTLSVDQTGKWTYTLDNDDSHVQALSAGQTVTDSFTVQVRDQYGTVTTQVVNVQVTGSNDAPVITSSAETGSVKEDGTLTTTGTLHATDIDYNDTLSWSVDSPAGAYGSLSVDATGKWTYTLDNASSNVQALAQGETAHDTFTVRVSDGHGGTDTQTVTINIAGTNDGPTVSTPVPDQVVLAQAPFSFSVAGNFADIDHGAVLHYSATLTDGSPLPSWMTINPTTGVVSGTPPANLGGGTLNTVTFQSESADYHNTIGAYDIDANGNITGVHLLFANASAQGSGGTLVNGVSQATIASAPGQSVGLFLIADGFDANHSFSNLDLVNGHLEFRSPNGSSATINSVKPDLWYVGPNGQQVRLSGDIYHSIADNGSNLNLNDDHQDHVHTTTANGQTTYSFEDMQGLGDRDFNDVVVSVQQTPIATDSLAIKVTATDNYGASASDTVNINLDHPPVANADVAAGTENQTLAIDVLANDTDPDANSILTVSAASVPAGQGSVSIVNNQVVFNPGSDFDHLAAGATQTVVVQYTIHDQFNIASSSTATITITGTDDAPVITSGAGAGTVQEDTALTATGQLTATDVDDGATQAWSVLNGAGTYGALTVDGVTGQWTYTLNNAAANVQALAAGESHTETFTVQVSDGLGGTATQQVNVVVTGTNDAPVITSVDQAGSVQEDSVLTATGQVTASDVDNGTVLSYAVADGAGTYGSLAVDAATGAWTYTLNNAAANVQALAAGESHTETFTVQVSDGQGGTTSQDVNVVVTGTNDAPVITSADQAGSVQEDSVLTATGQVVATDVDHGAVLNYAVVDGAGTYGSFAVDAATGQWTYSLNNAAANVQALAAGESHTETFTVQVSDGLGGTTSQDVNVVVTGTNDAPVITSADQAGSVQEDSVLTATGQVTASDVDNGTVLSYAVVDADGAYGSLAVDAATGQWTYTLNNAAANVQALAAGESHTETFTVQVSDGNGGTTSQDVNVVVTGTNDAPVIISADQAGSVQEDSVLTATGQVVATDVDHGAVLNYAVADGAGAYGSFAVDAATGQWTYTLNNAAANVQALAAGESHTETFTVQVTDGQGGTTSQDVVVTVTGTNDAPVITSADQAGSVQEDSVLAVTGQVTATDVDNGTVLSYAVVDGAGAYGSLAVDAGTGAWTYTLNNNAANVQALAAGESHTETFTVQVSDGQGGTTSQDVNVVVTGTNDAPVITSADQTGGVQEDSVLAVTGQVTASDVDNGAVLSYAVVGDGAGAYGALAVDAATGAWTYTLNNSAANVQALAAGETHTETFTVQVSDGEGGTTSQQVDVVVTGTNDAPVITSADQVGGVQEDSVLTATGQVTASDIDNGTVLSYAVVGDGAGTYGSLAVDANTGAWTYTLDNGAANVQALAAGETHTETFTVQVSDGNGGTTSQDVVVAIAGTNDAPVITSADQAGAVQEDSVLTATGQVTASDIDNGTVLSYAVVDGAGTYGSLAVDSATGAWAYTLNNDAANVQALSAGESHTETFTVQVSDGQGGTTSQDVNVTVTGTNDAPVVFDASATADQNTPVTFGLSHFDPDSNDTDTVTLFGAMESAGSQIAQQDFTDGYLAAGGHATLNADGTVTFDPGHDFDYLGAGESQTIEFGYTVTDNNGAATNGVIDVTVTGENDTPVVHDVSTTADQNTPVTFGLDYYDPDQNDVDSVTLFTTGFGSSGSAFGGSGGQLPEHDFTDGYVSGGGHATLNADGTVTFDPGHAYDWLGAGETTDVAFNYRVTDALGATATGEIDVTITGENDAPVVADVSATTDQNAPVILGLDYYDPDENDTDTVTLFETGNFGSAAGSQATEHDFTDSYLRQGGHATLNADGTVSFDPGHDFDYLAAGETQVVEFGYRVTDEHGATTTATIDVTVTGENDAPVVADVSATTDQNAPVTIGLNYYDPDENDTDTVTLFETVVGGSSAAAGSQTAEHDFTDGYLQQGGHATLNADGTVSFDPGHDFDYLGAGQTQDVVIGYHVTDSLGAETDGSITVTVTGENDAPVANDVTAATDQFTPTTFGLDYYDIDQNDTDTVTLFQTVNFGSSGSIGGTVQHDVTDGYLQDGTHVQLNADGTVTFDANHQYDWLSAGQSVVETVGYTVTDSQGATATSEIDITINGVNVAPVISGLPTDLAEQSSQPITLPGFNLSDINNADQLTVTLSVEHGTIQFNPPSFGIQDYLTVTQTGNSVTISGPNAANYLTPLFAGDSLLGSFTYTADAGFNGVDTVTVTASDDHGATTTGTISVADVYFTVTPDTGATTENQPLTIDVLANDVGDGLTLIGGSVPAGQGSVSIVNNQLVFDPGADFDHLAQGAVQTVIANYTVQDGLGETLTSTATITITGTNDAPVANADTATTDQNTAKAVNVLGNDTDPDNGDTLTLTNVVIAADALGRVGTASIVNNQVVFNPNGNFVSLGVGQSTTNVITYTESDGHGGTATSTETVTITGVDDAPVAVADTATTDQNTAKTVNVLANDTDPDSGDTLTVTSVSIVGDGAGHTGTASISGNQVVFNPNGQFSSLAQGQSATNTITYTVSDGHGGTATSTETVTVTGVNDAPVAVADTGATTANQAKTFDVLANDTDVDAGHVLTLSVASASAGTATIVNNQLVFDPGHDFDYLANGQTATAVVNYTMHDEYGATSSSTATITVTGVNDAPVVHSDSANGVEGVALTGNVLANDYDPEGHALTVSNAGTYTGTNGTLVLNADGSYSYTLSAAAASALGEGQVDSDTFNYTASDGSVTSSSTLTVNVTGVAGGAADETISGTTVGVGITNQIPAYNPTTLSQHNVEGVGLYPAATAGTGYGALINGLGYAGGPTSATFGENVLPQTDDGYVGPVSLLNLATALGAKTDAIQFYGTTWNSIYIGNNGVVSFGAGVSSYSPQSMPVSGLPAMIAPYWEDVDTRTPIDVAAAATPGGNSTGSDRVYYDIDANTGVITVTWDDVGTYPQADVAPDAFQLVLMPIIGGMGYDAIFRYEAINAAYGLASSHVYPQVGFQDGNGNNFNAAGTQTSALGTLETQTNTLPAMPGIQVYNISGMAIANGLQSVSTTLLNNDNGGNANTATITAVNGQAGLVDRTFALDNGGLIMIMSNGVYNYSAPDQQFSAHLAAGETEVQTVDYTVTTSSGSTVEHINIVTTGTNDAPVAIADVAAVSEGGNVHGNLFANDSDVDDGTVLHLGAVSTGTGHLITGPGSFAGTFGTLTVAADGSYSYAALPGPFVPGTDVFTYGVTDGIVTTASTLTVTVKNPIAVSNDTVSANIGHTVVTGNVLTNDTGALTVTGHLDQVGNYGTLFLNENGTYTYKVDTSNASVQALTSGQTLTDTFTYQATDGATTKQATVTVTYSGGTAPVAGVADDHITVTAGQTVYGLDSTPYLSEIVSLATAPSSYNYHVAALANTDDGSTYVNLSTLGPSGTPLSLEIGGHSYSGFYINSNGSVSFGASDPNWHPGNAALDGPAIIAPFYADATTATVAASAGTPVISYNIDAGANDGSSIITISWDHVGNYTGSETATSTLTDSFQLQLISHDGTTDALFRYGTMQWTQAADMTASNSFGAALAHFLDNTTLLQPATAAGDAALTTGSNSPDTAHPGVYMLDVSGETATAYTAGGDVATTGSVLANDPGTGDTVTAVNGATTAIDHTITLASGAHLTMYSDGEYIYRTDGAFDYLGAGQQATDSFAYTYKNASNVSATATVTVTVNGVGSGDLFTGTAGNDTLVGNANNNTIVGGHGNDTITGGGGSDTIVFNFGDGHDTVTDFNTATDVLDLSSMALGTVANALSHATQVGADTVLDFGNGDMITLTGVDKTHLASNDFMLT